MIHLPHRGTSRLVLALLILCSGRAYGQTQTPGQVTVFDPNLIVVDSVITQDPSGNIGIGTTTPAAALDVASGDLNVAGNIWLAGNIFKGGQLFIHDSGPGNTFFGTRAGNPGVTGDNNTGTGYFALAYNTIGSENTATGAGALANNTSGGENTASGFQALFSNTTGYLNTALGANTEVSRGDLQNATAIGANAVVNASNKIRLGDQTVTVIEGQVPTRSSPTGTKRRTSTRSIANKCSRRSMV